MSTNELINFLSLFTNKLESLSPESKSLDHSDHFIPPYKFW